MRGVSRYMIPWMVGRVVYIYEFGKRVEMGWVGEGGGHTMEQVPITAISPEPAKGAWVS